MLTQTNTLQQCHYDGLAKLMEYGLTQYTDEVYAILGGERTILHPPTNPASFFVVSVEDNTYFKELCLDIHCVYNGDKIPNFVRQYTPDIIVYAIEHKLTRVTFGSFATGYMSRIVSGTGVGCDKWQPYYVQYTTLIDEWN